MAAVRLLGAEVRIVPVAERAARALEFADERGMTMVPPYDHPHIIAGQGTVGLEIVADSPEVAAVIVPRDRAAGLSPVVRKVAAGAAETVPLIAVVNLARTLRELKERGLWLVGTADDAPRTLYDVDLTGPTVLVLGSEGEGMRRLTREACDELVSIPMAGAVESLNVSVATGVALFEAVRQRRAMHLSCDSGRGRPQAG